MGALDLGFYSISNGENFTFFEKLKNKEFKLIYLLGSDNFDFKKNDEFIVYQGSHGDRGAEIADLILPSPAFTEQNGLFLNLEGRLQECRKASYPINGVKEDWKIFEMIMLKNEQKKQFRNFNDLRDQAMQNLKNTSNIGELPNFTEFRKDNTNSKFLDEPVKIRDIDYYFSNSISRSSKTMSQCRDVRVKNLKEGTNN